jgi:hypothetical protein
MALLLVTYSLNAPNRDYSGFYDAIAAYPHVRLSESSYAIHTYETPSTLFSQLSLHMEESDHLYIMTLMRPWQAYGLEEVTKWLESHL